MTDQTGKTINVNGTHNTVAGGDLDTSSIHITNSTVGAVMNQGTQVNSFSSVFHAPRETEDTDTINVQGQGNVVAGGDLRTSHTHIRIGGNISVAGAQGGNLNIGGTQVIHGTHRVTVQDEAPVMVVEKGPKRAYRIVFLSQQDNTVLESDLTTAHSFFEAFTYALKRIGDDFTQDNRPTARVGQIEEVTVN